MVSKLDKDKNFVHVSKTAKFGKLVRIELDLDGKIIRYIKITGDFFLHPEEKIDVLESVMIGTSINDRYDITKRVNSVLKECKCYGFDANSIVELIHSFSTDN